MAANSGNEFLNSHEENRIKGVHKCQCSRPLGFYLTKIRKIDYENPVYNRNAWREENWYKKIAHDFVRCNQAD